MDYVVGFMFSPDGDRVALIRKTKPAWQAGLLNGIGGKIEPSETPMEAMEREFYEEAGVRTLGWCHFGKGWGPDFKVHFFTRRGDLDELRTTTEEKIEIITPIVATRTDVVPNLRWIIPMARLIDGGPMPDPHLKPPFFADIEYFS